jgi:hypothetical protein
MLTLGSAQRCSIYSETKYFAMLAGLPVLRSTKDTSSIMSASLSSVSVPKAPLVERVT